jgi:DNA invertase Pin-like site-specific DNA recombinase
MKIRRAYDDVVIDEIIRRKFSGEKVTRLAKEYHLHRKTVQNYCNKPVVRRYRQMMMDKFMQVS